MKDSLKRWHEMVYKYQSIKTIGELKYLGEDRFLANNEHNVSIDDINEYCINLYHFSDRLDLFIRRLKFLKLTNKNNNELVNTMIFRTKPPSEVCNIKHKIHPIN